MPAYHKKLMPEWYKDHASHDILLLCKPCITAYHKREHAIVLHLAEIFHAPIEGKGFAMDPVCAIGARKLATALLRDFTEHKIPTRSRGSAQRLFAEQAEFSKFRGWQP